MKESGGTVARDFAVLDVYRRYRPFKPQGIAELNVGGQKLAHALAEEIAAEVDALKPVAAGAAQESDEGEPHA